MKARTLSELQVELFNRLRALRLYPRLKSVLLEPSDDLTCGWRGEVKGDFTAAEEDEAHMIISDLQKRFSMKSESLESER